MTPELAAITSGAPGEANPKINHITQQPGAIQPDIFFSMLCRLSLLLLQAVQLRLLKFSLHFAEQVRSLQDLNPCPLGHGLTRLTT